MELKTNIYTVVIYKHPIECPLCSFPYTVKVIVCNKRAYNFKFTIEPTEKMVQKVINKALNYYILGGKPYVPRRKR